MVDQHSGISLTELEQSILETIEADGENAEAGSAPVADADTSSFMLDDDADEANDADTLSPLGARQSRYTGVDHHSNHPPRKISASLFTNNRDSTSNRPRASTETSVRLSGGERRTFFYLIYMEYLSNQTLTCPTRPKPPGIQITTLDIKA